MTRLQTLVAKVVLIGGAAASIATSQELNSWTLTDATAMSAVIDTAVPRLVVRLRGELNELYDYQIDEGDVTVELTLRARAGGPGLATGRVTIAAPNREPETAGYAIEPGGTQIVTLSQLAFIECAGNSCIDELTLTIQRDEQLDGPAVDVTGTATIDVQASGTGAPVGEIRITATIVPP